MKGRRRSYKDTESSCVFQTLPHWDGGPACVCGHCGRYWDLRVEEDLPWWWKGAISSSGDAPLPPPLLSDVFAREYIKVSVRSCGRVVWSACRLLQSTILPGSAVVGVWYNLRWKFKLSNVINWPSCFSYQGSVSCRPSGGHSCYRRQRQGVVPAASKTRNISGIRRSSRSLFAAIVQNQSALLRQE